MIITNRRTLIDVACDMISLNHMDKNKIIKFATVFALVFSLPTFVFATNFDFRNREERKIIAQKWLKAVCEYRIKLNKKYPKIPVPKICKNLNQEPKPATLELSIDKESINEGESATISWASENTLSCEASGAWSGERTLTGEEIVSPLVDSTYTLTCDGADGGVERSVSVSVVPLPPPPVDVCPNIEGNQELIPDGYHKEGDECVPDAPEPTLDHLIISEVYYDVDPLYGVESSNEWLEIYNGTGTSVDISGWIISDNSDESDLIPAGTIVPNGGFVVITASSTTAGFWSNIPIVNIGNRIGNSLANTSDVVMLKNGEVIVDAVSYGGDITAFDPSVPDVVEGHSIRRSSLDIDTNTASDWEDLTTPTPGSF